MKDLLNVNDEHSRTWRTTIDDIDECGLLNYETNQIEVEPIAKKEGRGLVHVEDVFGGY